MYNTRLSSIPLINLVFLCRYCDFRINRGENKWLRNAVMAQFAVSLKDSLCVFANPWRSSRLSSSLPQSSQRTAAKNAKPNHAPSETESLLKCGSIPYQLRTDNQIRSMPSRFGKRFYILTSEKLSGLGNSA